MKEIDEFPKFGVILKRLKNVEINNLKTLKKLFAIKICIPKELLLSKKLNTLTKKFNKDHIVWKNLNVLGQPTHVNNISLDV